MDRTRLYDFHSQLGCCLNRDFVFQNLDFESLALVQALMSPSFPVLHQGSAMEANLPSDHPVMVVV